MKVSTKRNSQSGGRAAAKTADVQSKQGVSRKLRRVRGDRPRARTIAPKRLTKEEIRMGALLAPLMDYQTPQTRGECKDGPRPCPFVRCRHHLYLDVNPDTGSIKLNFPHLEVGEMEHTCSLDVAERGGMTLEEVGHILNLTRERVRQVEVAGLEKLRETGIMEDISRVFGDSRKFE